MTTDDGVTIAAPNEATESPSAPMDLNDLAEHFMSPEESEAEVVEENTSEEEPEEVTETDQITEEVAETEETEDDPTTQPEESEEEEAVTEEADVLSKYSIPLDEMSEDELKELNRKIGGKSHKRINQLTAQKKQLEEDLRAAQSHASQQPTQANGTNPFAKATTPEELEAEADTYQNLIEWAEDSLDAEAQYDDDGTEYLVEANGQRYDKTALRSIKKNALHLIRSELPKRRTYIDQRQKNDAQAEKAFEFITNAEDPLHETFNKIEEDPLYKEVSAIMPNAKYVLASALSWQAFVQSKATKPKKNGKSIVKPKTTPASAGAATTRVSATKKKEQAQTATKSQLTNSGSLDDLAKHLELLNS